MKRSVRNGLAIAGMAGGLFFLGQAVASASDQVADASNGVTQTNDSSGGGGGGANLNGSSADAKNVDVTKVETDVDGGDGGDNTATINTGIVSGGAMEADSASIQSRPGGDEHHGDSHGTTVTLNTGDVSLTQNANGGDVNNSGNVAVADTGGSQTATATNTVNQSNSSEGDDHHGRDHHDGKDEHGGPASLSEGSDHHHGDGNANLNESEADATNIHKIDVDTDINGGDGGDNYAEINTGLIDTNFYCPEHSTCTFNIHTGNVTLVQNANGGSVNGSGNVGVGAPVPGVCDCVKPVAKSDCPEKAAPAAKARPAVKPASAPLSSAQPKGQLAFTGSDVSLPLTVGLLALVAGLGLTVLGRRRETQAI